MGRILKFLYLQVKKVKVIYHFENEKNSNSFFKGSLFL